MPGFYSKYIKLTHAIGDLAAVAISAVTAYYFAQGHLEGFVSLLYTKFFLFSLFAWIICASLLGTYRLHRVSKASTVIINAVKLLALYILLIEAALNIFDSNYLRESNFPPRLYLNISYSLLVTLVLIWRMLVYTGIRILRRKGYSYRRVIIAGYGIAGIELRNQFQAHPEYGYRFLGFFDDKAYGQPQVAGTIADIESFVLQNDVDEIYCCPFELHKDQLEHLIDFVDENLVRMKLLPELGLLHDRKFKVEFNDLLPVLLMRSMPLDDAINKAIKRLFDIVFSSLVIVFILSWLLPILAVFIRINSKGPIFFGQERSGINNKTFKCWKLRSMYVNTEANTQLARRGDARITPIGAFLRKTSLDELPQFFNVFIGDMSVVGPRPHMLKVNDEYAQVAEKYMVRHFIKPGVTGLSQVRGYRGDTTEDYQIRGRVKLDIFYLENWSFILDLKIIYYTVYNVIYGDEHAF